jgi:hypothetical protein
MLTDAELDARIVADMIANAKPKRKPGEKPVDYQLRINRTRASRNKRIQPERDAEIVRRYTSGEWLLFEIALDELTLTTGRAFLTWLERQAWLIEAHSDLRTLAYYNICRRADELKADGGLSILDDALGDKPTLGMLARDILKLR